jgi:hypothetical protein
MCAPPQEASEEFSLGLLHFFRRLQVGLSARSAYQFFDRYVRLKSCALSDQLLLGLLQGYQPVPLGLGHK